MKGIHKFLIVIAILILLIVSYIIYANLVYKDLIREKMQTSGPTPLNTKMVIYIISLEYQIITKIRGKPPT